LRLDHRIARHRPVEDGAVALVRAKIFEQRHAKFAEKPILSSVAQYRHEMLPDRVMLRSLFEQRHRLERVRMILSQQCAGFGQSEASAAVFREEADRGERTQQSIQ